MFNASSLAIGAWHVKPYISFTTEYGKRKICTSLAFISAILANYEERSGMQGILDSKDMKGL